MQNNRLTEARNYQSNRVEFGDEICHVSKSDVSYQRIPVKYDGKQFLLKAPKCKSFGVQTTEMENGYTRRTMPLVFDDYQSYKGLKVENLDYTFVLLVQGSLPNQQTSTKHPKHLAKGCKSKIWTILLYSSSREAYQTNKHPPFFHLCMELVPTLQSTKMVGKHSPLLQVFSNKASISYFRIVYMS